MNYYESRQRQTDGRWDWTVMNDGRIRRATPCLQHEDGHATREEAERHFWEHEIATAVSVNAPQNEKYRCEAPPGCRDWTQMGWQIRHHSPVWLCPLHHSREVLKHLHPFKPGQKIISSY